MNDFASTQSQFTYQAEMASQPNPFTAYPTTTENRIPRPKACTTCRSSKHRCDGQEGVMACSRCVRNSREVCGASIYGHICCRVVYLGYSQVVFSTNLTNTSVSYSSGGPSCASSLHIHGLHGLSTTIIECRHHL